MKHAVKVGQTDYTTLILIRDTAGAPKTALTYGSAGIDVCYTRVETDNDVVLTAGAPAETTLTGAHVDWGFVKVDDTNAPGIYKLDIADGVFATGAWSAVVSLICTGCDPVHIEFMIVPQAPYDGVNVATISANAITATAINADAITEAKIADNAIAAEHIAAGAIDAATFAADVDAEAAAWIWNAAAGSYGGAGTYGQAIEDILVDTATTLQGELDGIQADTEDIQSRLPAALVGGRMNSNVAAVNNIAVDGAGTSGDPWGPA